VSSILVQQGTEISVPARCMNRSYEVLGPSTKDFDPSRWLGDGTSALRAKKIHGHQ
ncbi:hypothetical protein B0H11DRAFT_1635870, partial [Mycena galericulata]